MPADLSVSSPLPKGIEMRVAGKSRALEKLSSLKLSYPIDLSSLNPGVHSITLRPEAIKLPRNVTVIRLRPRVLLLKIDRKINVQLPVVLLLKGEPAQGYAVIHFQTDPAVIDVVGPEDHVAALKQIQTKPFDISGVSKSLKKEVPFDLPENTMLAGPVEVVQASVTIAQETNTHRFEGIPVQGRGSLYEYEISPTSISFAVKGPMRVLEALKTGEGIDVYVDLKNLKPGVYVRRAAIVLPLNITLQGQADPEAFTVKISTVAKDNAR